MNVRAGSKKAECQKIDTLELLCWRRLLRVPWTSRKSNQLILKEINPEYSLEGLMLKLELQYFGHLMRRAGLLEKTLMLGKIEGQRWRDNRGWDGGMASPTQWTLVWADSRRWWRTGKPGLLQSVGSKKIRHDWVTEPERPSLWSNSHNCTRLLENHCFDYMDFVSKVMPLLFSTLSRFVTAFLPKSKYLLISWLQSPP